MSTVPGTARAKFLRADAATDESSTFRPCYSETQPGLQLERSGLNPHERIVSSMKENRMLPEFDLGTLERYRVPTNGTGANLADIDPRDQEGLRLEKAEARTARTGDITRIVALQEILYAQSRHALLIVLQGMDTSGKDGTIRKVFGPIDSLGVIASSFKKPTALELSHDFLWRIHAVVPPVGAIGIFNRSHYEDVLVARVHALAPSARIEARYEQINAFEKHLSENDVTILKFFLHISNEEQKRRLQARLDTPEKRWKFNPDDLAERALWHDYMAAYQIALARCSTEWAPWFIIPADRKWYRNAVIARIVRSTLETMDLAYPPEPPDLDKVRIL